MEHAPGPRGSPQEPHAPTSDVVEADLALAATANTESCCSSLPPLHDGH